METALNVFKFIPALIAAIKSLEEFMPVDGKGKEKLQMISDMFAATYENASAVWPYLAKIATILVTGANALGIFKKK